MQRAPGTIPPTVNPPHGPVTSPEDPLAASITPASAPATRVALAAPNAQSDGFFSNLARKVGFGGAADTTASAPPPTAPAAKPKVEAKRNDHPRPEGSIPKTTAPKAETKQAARPALKPSVTDTAASAPAQPPAPAASSQVAGSQPIVSANSFESRFSAAK
jgi:hypothetical protein